MSRIDEQDFDEKRLARRQRRKRSQLIAYICLAVFVLVIFGAGAFGIISVKKVFDGHKVEKQAEEEQKAAEEASAQSVVIETPETEQEPQEMTQEDLLDEVVNGCISEMPIEDKVAALFIVTPEQLTGVDTAIKAGSGTQDALSTYAVGGIVYSKKNIKSAEQISEMLSTTASMSKYPLFTMTNENGNGAITSAIGIEGVSDIDSSDAAYNAGSAIGAAMFGYGFNFDLAPNMDITESGDYGTDIAAVQDITASLVNGIQESGVSACAVAFPASADTSKQMVVVDKSKEELVTGEYTVFKNAIDNANISAIQMSNASFPQVAGDNTPASLSKVIIDDELRGALGFEGIVITGAMNEGAITEYYTPEQSSVEAIKAGADMIYCPEDFTAAYEGLLSAVNSGEISEDRINESLIRIYRIKYADRVDEIVG